METLERFESAPRILVSGLSIWIVLLAAMVILG